MWKLEQQEINEKIKYTRDLISYCHEGNYLFINELNFIYNVVSWRSYLFYVNDINYEFRQ